MKRTRPSRVAFFRPRKALYYDGRSSLRLFNQGPQINVHCFCDSQECVESRFPQSPLQTTNHGVRQARPFSHKIHGKPQGHALLTEKTDNGATDCIRAGLCHTQVIAQKDLDLVCANRHNSVVRGSEVRNANDGSNRSSPNLRFMKTALWATGCLLFFEVVATQAFAQVQVLNGPVANPNNGHSYYLLSQATWTDSEAKAVQLGGHLVTINNQAEQDWVFSMFASFGGVDRNLWIGLNDAANEGTFVWSSGEPVTYTHWSLGEPNSGAGEHYVHMFLPSISGASFWNDGVNDGVAAMPSWAWHGVVEVNDAGQGCGNWVQKQTSPQPAARFNHAIAYDSTRNQVVLFGGCYGYANETWTWDGASWTQRASHPSGLNAFAMVYDEARARMVLFGGSGCDGSANYLDDTWLWDGATWTQASPKAKPPGRLHHRMAYDSRRAQVVLFGGDVHGTLGADTWVWDGNTWTVKSPAQRPSGRNTFAMAYDPLRDRVVLFGGGGASGAMNDTWLWDGSNWTQVFPATSPPARYGHAMVYDAGRGKAVIFGGRPNVAADFEDTWLWDGSNWTQDCPPSSPPGRSVTSLAYDSARSQIVLFGGRKSDDTILGDTWVAIGPSVKIVETAISPGTVENPVVFTFRFWLPPNEYHVVQFKESLADATWKWLRVITGDGQPITISEQATSSSRFYRSQKLTSGFLSFPLHGEGVTPYNAPISAVMDHSGTPLDLVNPCEWESIDNSVVTFTGEKGERIFGMNCSDGGLHPGYKNSTGAAFLKGVVNYIGARCGPVDSEMYNHPERFLNYDGHSGYDYPATLSTKVFAAADGNLRKAHSWTNDHGFYIEHPNGYSTWYYHCYALEPAIEEALQTANFVPVQRNDPIATIGKVGADAYHLHFEVRSQVDWHYIVDPYTEMLWSLDAQ